MIPTWSLHVPCSRGRTLPAHIAATAEVIRGDGGYYLLTIAIPDEPVRLDYDEASNTTFAFCACGSYQAPIELLEHNDERRAEDMARRLSGPETGQGGNRE